MSDSAAKAALGVDSDGDVVAADALDRSVVPASL